MEEYGDDLVRLAACPATLLREFSLCTAGQASNGTLFNRLLTYPPRAVPQIPTPYCFIYTSTGEKWYICSFNAQPEAPAFFAVGPERAGASGWALNESISTGSGI